MDLTAGYRRRADIFRRKLELEFQVNINNVLDQDDIVITRLYSSGDIRTYEFQTPRQIFATTTVRL